MRSTVLFLLLPAAAWAQIGGPSLGLVPDGTQVRAMLGLPAAGAVGAVVSGGRELTNIAISPAQNYAIATAADDGSTVMVLATGAVSGVAGAAPNASRIIVSPQGAAAALWLAATSHFQILSGLPGAATVHEIDATAFGEPIAFAVSDDGHVAGSWPDGVRIFGADGSVNPVPIGERVVGLAFFAQRADLAVATVTRVLSVVGGAVSALYQPGAGKGRHLPDSPAGIAVSADNRWIAAAYRGGSVITVNVGSGSASKIECGCAPEGVFAIGGGVFRLTSKAVKLIDASSGSVFEVPSAGGPQ
jgi:DNA-binding beta-propeller fold protein YncE